MSAYADQVREWVNDTVRDFGGRIPEGFPLQFAYSNNLSDESLELYALELYRAIKNHKNGNYLNGQQNTKPTRMLNLVPYEAEDGSITFVDRYSGCVVAGSDRMPNGLFSYFGPDYMIEVLFGRGGLDRMWVRTEDNMFFRDYKKPKNE